MKASRRDKGYPSRAINFFRKNKIETEKFKLYQTMIIIDSMKVGMVKVALGIIVGVVIVLVGFASAIHEDLGFITSNGLGGDFYSASNDLNEFKMKMSQILGSMNQGKQNSVDARNEGKAKSFEADAPSICLFDVNRSSINPSNENASTVNAPIFKPRGLGNGVSNLSKVGSSEGKSQQLMFLMNSSFVTQSSENKTKDIQDSRNLTSRTGSGGSILSQIGSISQSGIHLDNQASFNGVWSIQAEKQGFGNSGINDRMSLSGDFNVQKTVSFKG